MITAMKQSPSKLFAVGACLPYVATAYSMQSIEILFAKNCKTYEIWGLEMASEFRSNLLASNFPVPPDPPRYYKQ